MTIYKVSDDIPIINTLLDATFAIKNDELYVVISEDANTEQSKNNFYAIPLFTRQPLNILRKYKRKDLLKRYKVFTVQESNEAKQLIKELLEELI